MEAQRPKCALPWTNNNNHQNKYTCQKYADAPCAESHAQGPCWTGAPILEESLPRGFCTHSHELEIPRMPVCLQVLMQSNPLFYPPTYDCISCLLPFPTRDWTLHLSQMVCCAPRSEAYFLMISATSVSLRTSRYCAPASSVSASKRQVFHSYPSPDLQ